MSLQAVHDVDGWERSRVRVENRRPRLTVYCPPGGGGWAVHARDYWEGRLSGRRVRQHAWGGQVHRLCLPSGRGYYLKHFAIRSPRFLHKPPRARLSLRNEARLARSGFSVPSTVCLIEERYCGVLIASAQVTEEIAGAHRLSHLLNDADPGSTLSAARKRHLLVRFGREAGRLHAAGFYHGDMHLHNVLCRSTADEPQFFWIDNERGHRFRRLPFRLQVDDLTQVAKQRYRVHGRDLMAAWRAYVAAAGLAPGRARRMVRRVIRRSRHYRRKRGWLDS